MSQRAALVGVWSAAAILTLSALMVTYGYALSQAASLVTFQFSNRHSVNWMALLGLLPTPLMFAACVAILMAIVVHATLWRRAELSSRTRPSP